MHSSANAAEQGCAERRRFSAWYLEIAMQDRLWKVEKTHRQNKAGADRWTQGKGPHRGHLWAQMRLSELVTVLHSEHFLAQNENSLKMKDQH